MNTRTLALACAVAVPFAGKAKDVYDAGIYSQIEIDHIDRSNRERYLEDVRAAGIGAVLLSFCEFFEEGAARRPRCERLADMLSYFESNGVPTAVWINGFGYGNELNGAGGRRLRDCARLTAFSGRTTGAVCPTDPVIMEAISENVRDAIRAGAKLVLIDDDFVQSVRPGLGCVCSNHLARISKKIGRQVTREDVRDSFTGKPTALRRAFLDVSGEVAVEAAKFLRKAADEVDPSAGLGLCASYTHYDVEGVEIDELLAAFAGNGRRFFRISGAPYWRDAKYGGAGLDGTLEFVRMQSAWMRGKGWTLLDENDPYPRKVSLVPPYLCELYDKAVIADGALARHKYMLCYGTDRSEPGYLDAHLANRADDAALKAMFAGTAGFGIRTVFPQHSIRDAELPVPYVGDKRMMTLFSHPLAAHFLVRNGIPVRHEGLGPSIAFGAAALAVDDGVMKRGVILDLPAARQLEARGVDTGLKRFGGGEPPAFFTHADDAGRKFAVFGFAGADLNFKTYATGAHRDPLLRAVSFLTGADLPVRVETSGERVYQIVSANPKTGTYSVLLENLADAPADMKIVTGCPARVRSALRGTFAPAVDGLELRGLAPHAYAAVEFECGK